LLVRGAYDEGDYALPLFRDTLMKKHILAAVQSNLLHRSGKVIAINRAYRLAYANVASVWKWLALECETISYGFSGEFVRRARAQYCHV
jgi:hypothetical protein